MPRKAKDEELNKIEKNNNTKKATASKKSVSNKLDPATKSKVKNNTKSVATKETTSNKSKKSSSSTSKKIASKSTKKEAKKVSVPVEYYDLPSVYNKTVVKILAQTPSCLFVYWEISEKDKLNLQKEYGEKFFQDTKPYLVIINETMNYSFETEINDYANSWYIHIHDSDCKYCVKLIRKPINNKLPLSISFVDITSSNEINAPNDHILFDKLGKTVFFKNVQTNIMKEKDISSLSFINNIGKVYNIYDFYKETYRNELNRDELSTSLSSSR